MKREYLTLLEEASANAANVFSNRGDGGKVQGIGFTVEKVTPTSDETAAVTFKKSGGLRTLAFFYLLKYKDGPRWRYFFPSDSHICGFDVFGRKKALIEEANYSFRKIKEQLVTPDEEIPPEC